VSPGERGRTKGDWRSETPKRALPLTEITGLAVASSLQALPPQPVRLVETVLAVSHKICWSEWENRFSGSKAEDWGSARYWALVNGLNKGPTLKMGLSWPWAQIGARAARAGWRP
jgi:hypothetical protein